MSYDAASTWAEAGAATFAVAAVVSVAIIITLKPWLQRIALAKPNARSSHREPTPQGGGIAVVAATIVAACGTLYLSAPAAAIAWPLLPVFAAADLDRRGRRRRRHPLDQRYAPAIVAGARGGVGDLHAAG